MLQNLKKLVGEDGVLRVHIVNERYNRYVPDIKLRNFIFVILYPFKTFILIMVMKNKLPLYIGTLLIFYEWFTIIFNIFFYRKLDKMYHEWDSVLKKNRLLSCTNYNLLISFFERPFLETLHKISGVLFNISVALSGREIQALIFVLVWIHILKLKDSCRANIVLYLREFIKEDLASYGIA